MVQYVSPLNLIQVRPDGQFCKTKPVIVRQWPAAKRGDQFAAKIGQVGISRHPQQISTVTISTHKMSVGVFSQFLGSLSGLSRPCGRLCRGAKDRSLDFARCTRARWTRRSGIVVKKDFLGTPDRTSQDCKDRLSRDGLSYFPPASLRTKFAAAVRPAISLLRSSNRCRASLSRSSTNFMAASPVNGPLTTGTEFSPMVSST